MKLSKFFQFAHKKRGAYSFALKFGDVGVEITMKQSEIARSDGHSRLREKLHLGVEALSALIERREI